MRRKVGAARGRAALVVVAAMEWLSVDVKGQKRLTG
jgi:hypothetical protein